MSDYTGHVSCSEVSAMVRLGQRTELDAYFRQFLADLEALASDDLVLARARFISLATTLVVSTLEIGAPPEVEATITGAAEGAINAETAEGLVRLAAQYLAHATTCARPNANRFAQQTIEKCKAMISESYALPINDSALAHEMGLSRSHFRYLFKEVTGMPFRRYLSHVRLNEAKRMITTTRRPIRDICFAVGYSDQSSFHRAYRAYHGVPPTADRHSTI